MIAGQAGRGSIQVEVMHGEAAELRIESEVPVNSELPRDAADPVAFGVAVDVAAREGGGTPRDEIAPEREPVPI